MPVHINNDDCVACGACQDVCPENAITMTDIAVIDKSKCVDCGSCIEECPNNAIKLDE